MNENNLNQENQNNSQPTAVGMVPTNNEPGVVTSTPLAEPVVNPTPINNISQSNVTNESNINQNSSIVGNNGNNEQQKNNKKLLYIIGGVILLIIIVVVLYFTVFKKSNNIDYKDYEDYVEEQEKQYEKLNENFSIKDYKVIDGILVELYNDNDVIVDANIKVEFYDENGGIVDLEEGYMFYVPSKSKSYTLVNLYEPKDYATYKVTAKLNNSYINQTYNDKVTIVSSNANDDEYLVQLKNDSDKKLTISYGVMFFGPNDTLIGFKEDTVSDVEAQEIVTGDVYIPYDENYDTIQYERAEVIILTAVYQ